MSKRKTFLCVYRQPAHYEGAGPKRLVKGEASCPPHDVAVTDKIAKMEIQ